MKHLFILRHAKSSWAHPGLRDEDRPLNARGLRQLKNLSNWISETGFSCDAVLCSTALRTRETWDGICESLPMANVEYVAGFYNGSTQDYLDAIYTRDEAKIMLVGHNPTCDELAQILTAPSSPEAARLMTHHFGTATLAGLEFDVPSWTDIRQGGGQLTTLLRPRDLKMAE